MARGWESKSVEAQQDEARQKTAKPKPPMTGAAAARWRESETLRLARARVVQQLASNPSPRHLALLQQTLADLDDKLNRLQTASAATGAPPPDV